MSKKKKARKPKKKARHQAARYLATLVLLVLVGYLVWVRNRLVTDEGPAELLPSILEEEGFTLNTGLSDLYRPGDVIQVAEADGDGEHRLPAALPFLRAADCFPELVPEESPYALPVETTGDAGATLKLGAQGLGRFLPKLGGENQSAGRYLLEIDDPRLLLARRPELSRRFSDECVARLSEAQSDGDRLEWFQVVHQAVVADGVRLVVETSTATSAEARLEAQKAARGAVAVSGDVEFTDEGETRRVYRLGRTVLAYKTRPLAPLLADRPAVTPPTSVSGRLRILAVEGRSSEAVGLDHGFRTGDWFRFAIRADMDGWVYVFHRPPGGELALLWPREGEDPNTVAAGSEVVVPPVPEGFQFRDSTGEEYFYVAITRSPRPPGTTGPAAPAEVVNYLVRGLSRGVGVGTVPEEEIVETGIPLMAQDGGTVAAVELRLRHEG